MQRFTSLAAAALTAFSAGLSMGVHAQNTPPSGNESLPEVRVTASPFSNAETEQVLTPARVLSGDDLRNRLGGSIGEALSGEMGVSASGFGAAASRPVIRGLEGGRVKIMENGMSVSDVSTISNDHAVGVDAASARQVEILRGPASLLYGSGAIGGLVNIVNDRIPTELVGKPTGEAELRIGSADRSKNGSVSADASAGSIGMHFDAAALNAVDYRIPGYRGLNDASSAYGVLPQSFNRRQSVGVGGSLIKDWGYAGASVSSLSNFYGVPTAAGSRIDLDQQRMDIDTLIRKPAEGLESVRFRVGYTDYKHKELSVLNVPQTNFSNKAWESRLDFQHRQTASGWKGRFGLQLEDTDFSAVNAGTGTVNTVLPTHSTSVAGFIVEERNIGALNISTGARIESVRRKPLQQQERSFTLASWSAGGLWSFAPGYGFGTTLSLAQRAPGTEELYSNGPHDATSTFDKGQPNLEREVSRNLEITLQKISGAVRWKANLFQNRIRNFTYGRLTGTLLDEAGLVGGTLNERIFSQADATLHGAEVEASYNQGGEGFSVRAFADTSRGRFDNAGSLPLQPATRVSAETGYKLGAWKSGVSVLRAFSQERLASFENAATSGYTRLDASMSYRQAIGLQQWTWFLLGRNLLNQDIRLSTSLLKDVAPLTGRSLIVGLRTQF